MVQREDAAPGQTDKKGHITVQRFILVRRYGLENDAFSTRFVAAFSIKRASNRC